MCCIKKMLLRESIWRETLAKGFSCEFCKIFTNIYIIERFRTTTSDQVTFTANLLQKQPREVFYKESCTIKNFITCNFIKKRLQHKCFPVNIARFLRKPNLKNICERLLLHYLIQYFTGYPANIYLLKVINRNNRKRCEICFRLTIKTLPQRQSRHSGVVIVNFEHISHLFLVLLLLPLTK